MDDDKLLVEARDGVGWLTVNNPARRNAVNAAMRARLPGLIAGLGADPAVRVVVLRGAGGRAFISGADMSEFDHLLDRPEGVRAFLAADREIERAMAALEKPLIAMIGGYCIGGGILYALRCDLRVAADDARFAMPTARMGGDFSYPGMRDLAAAVGAEAAADLAFTARQIDAAEALRMGLVSRVVPRDELESAVSELAAQIAANAPLTIRAAKAALREHMKPAGERDLARCRALAEAAYASEDYREGRRAFREKRTPQFRGA